MDNLTPEDQCLLQAELSSGESVLWTGKPNRKVIFHTSDWLMIPFSLMWGGFAIFWETGVTREAWNFGTIWGIPFVLIGQYMIWGRFLYAAWRKDGIAYALTNQRLLVVVRPPKPKVISMYLQSVTGIQKEIRPDGIGIIKFGETTLNNINSFFGRNRNTTPDSLYLNSPTPVFVDIDQAVDVAARIDREVRRVKQVNPNQ